MNFPRRSNNRQHVDGGSRHAYFLGTPFCGSTVFGQALGTQPSVTYLGEVDRLVQHEPSIWAEEPEPTCQYCELRGQPCPVWTPERVASARRTAYGKLMDHFGDELGTPVVIDGSKHPHWLRAVVADQPLDPDRTVAFLTVRSPFAFADSYRYRTGCQMWEASNLWRDVYYDGLRMLTRLGVPFMVVRYEQFALAPESILRPACALLGVEYRPSMLLFQEQPSHDIGGNVSSRAVPAADAGFSAADFRERLPDQWVRSAGQSDDYWGKPFGGWVDTKWHHKTTADDLEMVLQTPGLMSLANLLGYELSREIVEWKRHSATATERPGAS